MKRLLIGFIVLLFISTPLFAGGSSTLRCESSYDFAEIGDSTGAVADKLGEPDRKVEGPTQTEASHTRRGVHVVTDSRIDYWYYWCDGLEYRLTFKNDQLISIDMTGRRE